jgi:hypothetical protein
LTGKGALVVDYGKLADKAKLRQDAENLPTEEVAPKAFFEKVRVHLFQEMKKANAELQKRGADHIGQNHLPGFDNEMFLTFGTDLLCRVTLNTLVGECRITAVLSGPPNGSELSRKEYPFDSNAASAKMLLAQAAGFSVVDTRPREIAVDIISSILAGKFN